MYKLSKPTSIFVFLLWWPVAVTVVWRRGINWVNPIGQGEALKSRATRTTIGFSIAPIFIIVLARFLGVFSMLRAIEKQGLYFLKLRAEEIGAFIMGMLFGLRGRGAKAPGAASIYLADSKQKVKGGFGLRSNSFLDELIPDVFSTAVLLSLSIDRKP